MNVYVSTEFTRNIENKIANLLNNNGLVELLSYDDDSISFRLSETSSPITLRHMIAISELFGTDDISMALAVEQVGSGTYEEIDYRPIMEFTCNNVLDIKRF